MLVLLESNSLFLSENFFEEFFDFLLSLDSVQEDLAATALLRECALFCDIANESVGNRNVRQNESHVFLDDVPIFVKVVSEVAIRTSGKAYKS